MVLTESVENIGHFFVYYKVLLNYAFKICCLLFVEYHSLEEKWDVHNLEKEASVP